MPLHLIWYVCLHVPQRRGDGLSAYNRAWAYNYCSKRLGTSGHRRKIRATRSDYLPYGHAVCEASTEFKGCTFAISTHQPSYSTSNCTGVLLHGCKSPTHTESHLHHVRVLLGLYNGSTSMQAVVTCQSSTPLWLRSSCFLYVCCKVDEPVYYETVG